jgi:diadenosine tetraphosphate (Ap4A) HIT family hydrolase
MAEAGCPFCGLRAPVLESELAVALEDKYPVAPGHLLVVPRRHVASYFDATAEEKAALWELVEEARNHLVATRAPDGFNLGVNVGEAAGQTVFHLHIHVIPRYTGDMSDPRGGVRGVIPSRQSYRDEGGDS